MSDVPKGPMEEVPSYLWRFAQDQEMLVQAAHEIHMYLSEVAQAASIFVHAINARAKTLASYESKSRKYNDPATQILDGVAARVILFTTSARDDLIDLIKRRTDVLEHQNPGDRKFNGYDSQHLVITGVQDDDARARYPKLALYLATYPGLEIQLRSVASHAWAEYEHDVRYKPGAFQALSSEKKQQINQWFVEAGGMRRVMDDLFAKIEASLLAKELEPTDETPPAIDAEQNLDPDDTNNDDPLTAETLGTILEARHPGAERGDRSDMEALIQRIRAVGVTTVGELEAALAELEPGYVAQLMDYQSDTSALRRLDDEILAAFADRWVTAAEDSKLQHLLQLRLRRVRGKFAIYSVETPQQTSPLMTAARTVRFLATLIAKSEGLQAVKIDGAIALDRKDLNPSTNPRTVRGDLGVLYVTSNLYRAAAEDLMRILVERSGTLDVKVIRAGDKILPIDAD